MQNNIFVTATENIKRGDAESVAVAVKAAAVLLSDKLLKKTGEIINEPGQKVETPGKIKI